MAQSTTLTIRVDAEIKHRLDQLAKQQRRSKSFVAVEAIGEYLAIQEAQIAGIHAAIAELNSGEAIAHDHVRAWVESWDSANEQAIPKP